MPSLKLQIMSARNVAEGEYTCNISIGKTKQKTKTSKKSSNPEWNETFTLNIEESDKVLNIELDQKKTIGHKSYGTTNIDISTIIKGKERIWFVGDGLNEGAE